MSMKESAIDRMWLHDLGMAEGIEHLVDDGLLAQSKRNEGLRNSGQCCECGGNQYVLKTGPEGQRVCPACYDVLEDWYIEHAPKFIPGAGGAVCSTFGCGAEPVSDSDLCERCDMTPPDRAFYP